MNVIDDGKRMVRRILEEMLHDPLKAAERMESMANHLLRVSKEIRETHQQNIDRKKERIESEGGIGDRVTIEVHRVNPSTNG